MKRREIVFRPKAEGDLFALHSYIVAEAGLAVADAYIGRIEAACKSLETFPERGTRRDDIGRGLRTMGFERRVTIVFRVARSKVEIVRIVYGGQVFARALHEARADWSGS
ncbi:MAG: type II toxin-antitoxin system RelE/ParE family toxin [Alphaproteobacteria bacterium]|nr:type II toxin-antitoxin system RelE/ParE family toxin [Alphaproteobacteria bacterium]